MGVIYSRAHRQAAKAEARRGRAEPDYLGYRLGQPQSAGQQARRAYDERQQTLPPGMLAVAGEVVYLTPRHSPLAMSPAEARWLANEILNAAGAAERGIYG